MNDIDMVDDADMMVVKAFMFALYSQEKSLPESVQQRMQAIGKSLGDRASELLAIARSQPSLEVPFDKAYKWLIERAAERGMGIEDYPVPPKDAGEIGNVSRALEDPEVFFQEFNSQNVPKVLTSPNSVKRSHQEFN